jgi:hypothetical protein
MPYEAEEEIDMTIPQNKVIDDRKGEDEIFEQLDINLEENEE